MGYDVSFHPISPEEMQEWYFTPLSWVQQGVCRRTAGTHFAGLLRRKCMGYDVSFHPISPEEMQEWYFTPLSWVQQGQEEKVLALATQHGMEDFYAKKYLDTLRVGAETEPDELFDNFTLR